MKVRVAFVFLFLIFCPKLLLAQFIPSNNSYVVDTSIVFNWDLAAGPYEFDLSSDSLHADKVISATVIGSSFSVNGLNFNTKYYWSIQSLGSSSRINLSFRTLSPKTISSLNVWLKADDGVVLGNNNKVLQWTDKSNHGNNFVQGDTSSQPIYLPNVSEVNNRPAIYLDGINDFLSLNKKISISTIYMIANYDSNLPTFSDFKSLLGTINPSSFFFIFLGEQDKSSFYVPSAFFGNSMYINNISTLGFSPLNQHKMIFGSTSPQSSDLNIGIDRINQSRCWKGNVVELLVFDEGLGKDQKRLVEDYLFAKYSPNIDLGRDTVIADFSCSFLLKAKKGKYTNYAWSTGDTTSSINVVKPGKYFVSAKGVLGNVTTDTISVNFSNYPILYSDTSLCTGQSFIWDPMITTAGYDINWLKGGTYISSNPSIIISSPGIYTLSLTGITSGCSLSRTISVSTDVFPLYSLLSDTSLCSGNSVSIKSFGNTIKSYLWNGLVTTSSFQITTGGGYTLKTVNQNNCINNTTFNVTISGIAPSVFFTSSVISDTVCVSSSIQFSNGSTFPNGVNSLGYRWDFGNGISNGSVWTPQTTTYTASGQYFVTLSVAGDNGCSNTFSRKMTVLNNPVSIFTSSAAPNCQRDTIRFFNGSQANNIGVPLSTYLWNFGNPSSALNTSTIANPSFAYSNIGNYTVTYQVGNKYGCKNTSTRVLPILGAPIVNFTATKGCFGTPISFSDSTVNAPNTTTNSRLWSFGNGSSSTASNATITYSSVGSYTVSLLSTNNVGCSSIIRKTIVIKDSPVPGISYGPACGNSYIQFYDNSSMVGDTIINWVWQFGSSQSSALQNPKVILGDTGTYNVSLTVGTKTCTTTISRPERVKVNIRPTATFVASPSFGSPPLTVTLTSSLTGISSWKWTLGQSTLTSTLAPPITAIYPDSGQFKIRLSTYLSNGCVDSSERIILVSKPVIDLSVSSLGVSANNGNQQISVLLSNVGNIPIDGVTLYLKSKEGFELLEKSTLRLDVGSSTIYTFNGQIPTNTNRYPYFCVEAWPSSLTDNKTGNNKTCKLLAGGFYVGNPFPNPTSNDLYLPISVEKGDDVAVILVDMLGQQSEKTVYSFSDNGFSSVALPTSNLAAGVYMIYLTYQDQVVVKKFVKN